MNIRQIQEDLYPRIFIHAERLFPELSLRRTSKGYTATRGNGFDGSEGKAAGKINYLESSPAVLFDNRAGITRNVLKYIQEREHLPSYFDALRYCAAHVGYTLPEQGENFDTGSPSSGKRFSADASEFLEHEFEREYHKRQAFEEVQHLFTKALWQTANPAHEYLRYRGYTDEDIRQMHAGCALPFTAVQKHLRASGYADEVILALGLQSSVPDRTNPTAWHRIGETYTVSFPLRDSVGRMKGFIVRATKVLQDEHGKDRFPKYVFTKNFNKSVPVGFHHTLKNADVLVVEGVVDALFLQARGIPHVIAAGGRILTDDQFQTLEHYRIRSLTLCFDNDAEGKNGTFTTIERIRRKQSALRNDASTVRASTVGQHISQHAQLSWNLYVCRPEALSPAKDPDEFVRTHGVEAFTDVLKHKTESAERFVARFIAEQARSIENVSENNLTEKNLSDKERDTALERLWNYAQHLHSPFQTQDMLQEFSAVTGLDVDVVKTAQTLALENYRREQERSRLVQALAKADHALRTGEHLQIVQSGLQKALQTVESATTGFPPYSLQTFLQDIRSMPDGLRTGFAELDDTIRLSQNGITIVAARPSHGKTSFKMNLLLNLLEEYPDRTFVFFSYEEPVKIITLKLLNILANVRFQGQQLPDLTAYLRQTAENPTSTIAGVEEAKSTLSKYLESGRLVLAGERYTPDEIKSLVTGLRSSVHVGGVFVDYIQKIKPRGKFTTRQLELQQVSAELHALATEQSVPVIVGAQFNREVRTESDIREDCLREAGDLEQDANLVLALWNPAKTEHEESFSNTASNLVSSGIDPRRVELKVKTLKNRDGAVNLKGVSLLYDMPLSTIRSTK